MLRVHLTAEDLLRVKFASQPAPLIELGHALAAAQRLAALGPAFGLTKRQLRQRFLARVHDLAVFNAEVDAIWQAPPTQERIRSFMTSLQ